jgi:hypothetical protein
VTAAIFGLLGVVIGGTLAAGLDYLAKRRDERAALRPLAREILYELLCLKHTYERCLKDERWADLESPPKLPAAWTNPEPSFGNLLTWEQWAELKALRELPAAMHAFVEVYPTPEARQEHLPPLANAAVTIINGYIPVMERLAGARQ